MRGLIVDINSPAASLLEYLIWSRTDSLKYYLRQRRSIPREGELSGKSMMFS